MSGQSRPGIWAVAIDVYQLVTRELRYKYFQQQQLHLDAPVYDAAELTRAAQEEKTRRAAAAHMREQQQIMAANHGGGQVGLASGLILAAQGVKEYQGTQRGQGCQGVGSSGKSRTARTSGKSARRISSTIPINLGRSRNSRNIKTK